MVVKVKGDGDGDLNPFTDMERCGIIRKNPGKGSTVLW